MKYKRIIAGLFIVAISAVIFGFAGADDDPISRIAAQLDKWLTTHPQEKVYLQLDKPYYAIGDDIWFKAYITTGSKHQLSAISGVLNVELINDKDSIKRSVKLPVVSGLTWGDFSLPDTLSEGNYRIRAYTNWMRNAGEDYFFEKTITVTNSISNNVFTRTAYTFSAQTGQPGTYRVNAAINYSDLDGKPFTSVPVSYQVVLGAKTITKGKGQTDDKGNLEISFANNTPGLLNSGRIITELKINKKSVVKSILIKAASSKVDLQFFPEGGDLVMGNNSKIAFKAVGADGLGTEIKGMVTDDQNNPVTSFNSSHLGMGDFEFTPQSGKTYKAKVTYANGSENTVELPGATDKGYSLSINNDDAGYVKIKITPGPLVLTSPAQPEIVSLVAQSGGVIYYAGKSKPGSKSFTAAVPKSKFPSGIIQFTLFSSTGEPLNERLVFIQNHDQLKLDVSSEKQTYAPREKVKIELNAMTKDAKPAAGSFSVAVTNETTTPVDETDENTILSNLLLTSDLKGYIEKPGYYFTNESEKTQADLDVLMLTQGYRRFEWQQVLSDNFAPVIYQPEKTLEISGRIKTLGGKPVAHGKVTLFTTSGGIFMIDTLSDNKGKFTFKHLAFKDSIRFVIQARTAKDRKNLQIDVDNVNQQKVGENKNAPDFQVNISDGRLAYLQNSKDIYAGQLKYGIPNNAIMLKQVEIKEKKEEPIKNSSNLNGPGNADQVIRADQLSTLACGRIADCLQGMLTGVIFRNDTPYLTRSFNRPMHVVIDGVGSDAFVLSNLNANDIESIEVLRNIGYTSIYGGAGGNGVLIITTKRGGSDYSYQRYAPGIITYMPKGYYKARAFYAPQYDKPETDARIPDLRSTIYWTPNIFTGKDGKASFMYFNADTKGTYRVVIEGIDYDGNLGRKVYHYKVE